MERMTAAQYQAGQGKPKGQKNAAGKNAKAITVDGIRFDSGHESKVYGNLLWRERAGEITDLERQQRIYLYGQNGPILTPTGRHMFYKADFTYKESGELKVVDAKGYPSDVYLIKKEILLAMGVEIIEL